MRELAAGVLCTAAISVAAYACVLYGKSLQLRRQEVYIQGFVQTLDMVMRARDARKVRDAVRRAKT
jgi:Flp pilus assembly protein TadB